jgi:acetyl-CoA carboxylase carboxyltransferase component
MKSDRMLEIALARRLPVVMFAEGGGGRPGDTEGSFGTQKTFNLAPQLSGKVPVIGITTGYCFAGNAAMLGVSDVIIATRNANIGMGGPAMVEGGGLGVFKPKDIGPAAIQAANGVIDVLVADEAEAVAVAKTYLSYWQGPVCDWAAEDQRLLRNVVPLDRKRSYDVRRLIAILADAGSVLELRENFGRGMITAFIRIEGRPLGLIANNPNHMSGAIDRDGADKAARFMQLCQSYRLPLISLCDTPGIMVGPDSEKTALVRHSARLLVTGANLTVPVFVVVVRRAYGLGKAGMAAGSFKASTFAVAWPTGEFGAMNFEGAAKLAYRKELEAIEEPEERMSRLQVHIQRMIDDGKALARAMDQSCDDVIDPAETRRWIVAGLRASAGDCENLPARTFLDTW